MAVALSNLSIEIDPKYTKTIARKDMIHHKCGRFINLYSFYSAYYLVVHSYLALVDCSLLRNLPFHDNGQLNHDPLLFLLHISIMGDG